MHQVNSDPSVPLAELDFTVTEGEHRNHSRAAARPAGGTHRLPRSGRPNRIQRSRSYSQASDLRGRPRNRAHEVLAPANAVIHQRSSALADAACIQPKRQR